jgi:hypothetical protein
MRWPGDELVGPLEKARRWLEDNPCPDEAIGEHLRAMVVAYSEIPGATVPRMMELRDIIQHHAKAVDRRDAPRHDDEIPSRKANGITSSSRRVR